MISFVFASFIWLQTCRCCSAWNNPTHVVGRRRAAIEVGTAAFVGTAVIHPLDSNAAAPVNPAEAVRRGAANIPGYGQTDVFYPSVFAGNWKAIRELQPSGLTLEYSIRFLPSIEDDAIVADRGFNQANLEQAIAQIALQKAGDSDAAAPIPSYQWVETNPNDLRIKFANGKSKDIKVTKRATEKAEDAVFSSEFQRVTQEDARGIPQITARRVISKWRVVEGSIIEGIEVVYDAGGGDPLAGTSDGGDQNKILSKSKIRLQKQ